MPLKLRFIKKFINATAKSLLHHAPEREPTGDTTKLIDRVAKAQLELVEAMRMTGVCPVDENIGNLIEAVRRAIIYIAEEDHFYRSQLESLIEFIYLERKGLHKEN